MYAEDLITNSSYQFSKTRQHVLRVYSSGGGPSIYANYDFAARVLTVSTSNADGGVNVLPFAQLDPETLHFFRGELIKLGGKPPELPNDIVDPSAPPTESWIGMGADGIAQVSVYPAVQKKITSIFNFVTRQLQVSTENLRSHNEAFSPAVSFDDVPQVKLEQAIAEFTRGGQEVDRACVLSGVTRLKKSGLSS